MTDPLYLCPEHGYTDSPTCPGCGRDAKPVLSADRRERLSKFISGSLRHFPDDVGIRLDDAGWTDLDRLVDAVERRYGWASREEVEAVVASDPKGRFQRSGDRVRATYGHSVNVEIDSAVGPIPEVLYHGTPPSNLDSILEDGLMPMGRQEVHLSDSVSEARGVGRRRTARPAIIRIDAGAMLADGHDVQKRGPNTYTADAVPPPYLEVVDPGAYDPG